MSRSSQPRWIVPVVVAAVFTATFPSLVADEGQWPLSMIHQLDLAAKGIEIPAREIYNPDGPSLVDGVCRVGGGTGSFVSPQGLILTNHHVAFDGVQAVSTTDQDYLTKGFAAARLEDELPAKDYVCRITVGYRDVSSEILSAVDAGGDPIARGRAIMLRSRELVAAAEQENPGRKAEVSEMFQGSSYVLFLYQEIPDVRLVCVPPRAVGEYGGEDDNWIWPRHTGDFSFLRAYVGPDGNPAPFSRDNVPFQPRKHLMVEPRGVQEGDAVFLLGYPGRTYRHQSSWYIESEKSIRLPFYADLFREQIAYMNELSAKDAAVALALAPDIKGRANVRKNYDGKLLGISRLDLVAVRRAEEDELMEWLEADQARFRRYGDFMSEVKEAYEEELADGIEPHLLRQLTSGTTAMRLAREFQTGRRFLARPEGQRPEIWRSGSEEARKSMLDRLTAGYNAEVDAAFLGFLVRRAMALAEQRGESRGEWMTAFQAWMERFAKDAPDAEAAGRAIHARSWLTNPKAFEENLARVAEGKEPATDPLLDLQDILDEPMSQASRKARARAGRLDAIMARYVEAKQIYRQESFFPDANSTLRMTTGHVRGYSPRDGVLYRPFTTLGGVVEKHRGKEPFDAPVELRRLYAARDFGDFADPKLKDVPVAFLYDTDTTGGNSGSPVLNARGHVVGVNFDRCFEATINDYQWSEDYSRSIGVDIRYVLWVTQKLMKAGRVLDEIALK